MKQLVLRVGLLTLFGFSVFSVLDMWDSTLFNLHAQTPTTHSAIISWAAPSDADATSTYTVWRISSPCPGQAGALQLAWVQIAGPITALSYTDTNLKVGSYCWMVTTARGTPPYAIRSMPSNLIGGTVTPNAVVISGKPGS